jgi:hypothetical protein
VAWIATGVLAGLATAGVVAWIALTRPDWLPLRPASTLPRAAAAEEPLPVPKPSEALISRGRALYEDGRLRDALRVLDTVAESDSLRRDADELRAEIQRKLLEVARIAPAPPPAGAAGSAQPSAPGAPPRAPQAPQPPPST